MRVCVNVAKELVLCFVQMSGDVPPSDLRTIPLAQVDEIKVTRWTPEGDRAIDKDR